MPQCEATTTGGTPCKGNAKEGERWCHYHKKKFAQRVTHGRTAAPELLGIPKNQQVTFQQFMDKEKPLELLEEISYLRTLGVELRKTIERNRQESRQEMLDDYRTRMESFFIEQGWDDEELKAASAELTEDMDDLLLEYIGPAEPITADDIATLTKHVEAISRVAEKAKKIKDGFTLNVDLGNVHAILQAYTQHVVLPNVKCRLTRSNIVEDTRAFGSRGIQKVLQGEVL